MEGSSAKKSTSLETLVIQNISNVNDLKVKLNDIIKTGKDYEYEVSSCIKSLLTGSDQEVTLLAIQAVSELVKCEEKREIYANKDTIEPILKILEKEYTADKQELVKQCCRALGNLCCDCDSSRNIILQCNGVKILKNLLDNCLDKSQHEIKILICKTLLNFGIGGQEFCEAIVRDNVIDSLHRILNLELLKHDMEDDTVSTVLQLLSVVNDNVQEVFLGDDINKDVLNVLRETSNLEISELCLEHFNVQAEHDPVKTLIAKEGGGQLLCIRLQQLLARHEAGQLSVGDAEVEGIVKQACELVIIVLTGDEAMHILYEGGSGEVYLTMVRWLDSTDYNLLTTAVLAVGNFARQDDYCIQMMKDGIYDKLLDIFEAHQSLESPEGSTTLMRVQHAALSALRNLAVPAENKRSVAERGRAAPLLLKALPNQTDHHVAYKLLAAIRMLLDGQECVAEQLAGDPAALGAVCLWAREGAGAGAGGEAPRLLAWGARRLRDPARRRRLVQLAGDPAALGAVCLWAREGAGAGAGGEAPRLLAWGARRLRDPARRRRLVQVDGCIASLVNMLLVSHSLMQNEAILALTLLAVDSLKNRTPDSEQPDYDYEKSFSSQLIKSEIGKHISVLVDTNCAKMPIQVAENLLAFLDITSKNNEIVSDYKEAKVQDTLKKFSESRTDLSGDNRACIEEILKAISTDNGD